MIEKTACYSFFLIQSAGELDFHKGFLPEENSAFLPSEITKLLGITPFRTHTIGALKPNGKSRYNFSAWYGCKQTEPETSRFDQCWEIVQQLQPHIQALKEIKAQYRVNFSIQIFPCSKNEGCAVIGFSQEIIKFCYLTGTELVVDMVCYQD
ncbi:MAG: DUF4279 domain-containing protein [Anaerotruncus sp.]|nr:DUF4279 domain-containing protein [Anaerotruncus sp.]